ncbi:MAG: 50S ribosomal protein L21 [Balneolales bacterium]
MYAVVQISGHQFNVKADDLIYVDRQDADVNEKISFDKVLLVSDKNGKINVGSPVVKNAVVEASVVEHVRADKIIVFKKKRRKGYKKTRGHRQDLTQIKIENINI